MNNNMINLFGALIIVSLTIICLKQVGEIGNLETKIQRLEKCIAAQDKQIEGLEYTSDTHHWGY